MIEDAFFIEDLERRETRCAGERVAAKGARMGSRREALFNPVRDKHRSEREAARDAFREGASVRFDAKALGAEEGPKPSITRLHLIKEEEGAPLIEIGRAHV